MTEVQFSRTELLLGKEAMQNISRAKVAVFGIGGVGGYTVEALVRSGIQYIDLIDDDVVSESNLNRQIIALHSTIGKPKVEVMKERILDIYPKANVTAYRCFFLPETADSFDFSKYDYIIDAVDTITAKIALILKANQTHTPIISSMGAGNKLDPSKFEVADIYKTEVCPLAKVMRRELKRRGIQKLKVVYSKELPVSKGGKLLEIENTENMTNFDISIEETQLRKKSPKKIIPGSTAFVPASAGLLTASEVIKDLITQEKV